MLIPIDRAPPLMTMQGHFGSDWTTVPSCLQHELVGVEELPVMKSRHGDRLTIALVQLLDWADALTKHHGYKDCG